MKRTHAEQAKAKGGSYLGKWLLLTGQEQHRKRELLAQIRREAEAASSGEAPTWEVLDGPSVTANEVLARSQTGALFGGARVIVIREADRLPRARRRRGEGQEEDDGQQAGAKSDEQRKLADGVGPLPAGVTVVLVTGEVRDRRKPELAAPLRNAIAKHGLVIECPALHRDAAVAWAIAQARERGKRMEPAAAGKLVDQKVGTALSELESEVEKLALFVGDASTITAAHVDQVTPRLAEESIFRLLDAVRDHQPARAAAVLRDLLRERRESPGRVLWMLADTIRLVWQAKLLAERGWKPGEEVDEETARLLPQDPRKNAPGRFSGRQKWLWGRMLVQANGLTWLQLARAMQALHGCDLAMKGIRGKLSDDEAALELLVIQLCSELDMPVWQSPAGERVLG